MTEFTTHYFHVSSTGEEVAGPVPDAIYAVGDAVFLDNLKGADKRGTWVRITGKRSIVHALGCRGRREAGGGREPLMGAFIAGAVIGAIVGVLAERADLRADVSAGLKALWAKRPWK